MSPVPIVDDLIWAFEGEPTPRHPARFARDGTPVTWRDDWPYTAVTFLLQRGSDEASFYIEPGYEIVRIRIQRDATELVDLDLGGVRTVSVERIHHRELLHVEFRDPNIGTLFLRTRPDFSVGWSVGRLQ
jgi:hypothetical protein